MNDTLPRTGFSIPVILLILALIVDYGQPQILAPLRPGLIIYVLLLIFLIKNIFKLKDIFSESYVKLYILLMVEMVILGFLASNNFWAYNYFIGFLLLFILVLSIIMFIEDSRKLKILLTSFMILMTFIAGEQVFTGARYHLGGAGVLGDLNDLGMGMAIAIPISFFLGFEAGGIKRITCWLAATIQILAIGTTSSRGSFIGLTVVLFLCWLKSKMKIRFLLIMAAVSFIFLSLSSPQFMREILDLSNSADSGTGKDRIELWKVAWATFLHNPVFGVGQGNLPFTMGEYANYDPLKSGTVWTFHLWATAVHSVYMTCLAELGIIGTAIWVGMIIVFAKKYRAVTKFRGRISTSKNGDDEGKFLTLATYGISIGLIGFLVTGIFLSAFYYPHFWILSAFMTCIYRIHREKLEIHDKNLPGIV